VLRNSTGEFGVPHSALGHAEPGVSREATVPAQMNAMGYLE
jgi:hypothetical protein